MGSFTVINWGRFHRSIPNFAQPQKAITYQQVTKTLAVKKMSPLNTGLNT
jgi:hypothetical protein